MFDFEVCLSEEFWGQVPEGYHAYHITWATHNSRVSERMVEFKAKRVEPVILSEEWQNRITREIRDIVREDNLKVLAYNILPDHVHLVLVCQEDELSNIIRKLKGRSAQKLKECLGIDREEMFHLWAQKFNCSYIESEAKLNNAIEYVRRNREKHGVSSVDVV